ncbi:MAG: hypothetical protein ABIG30_03110 [Candidatus Aenigmatarchaeota archaeon]
MIGYHRKDGNEVKSPILDNLKDGRFKRRVQELRGEMLEEQYLYASTIRGQEPSNRPKEVVA